MNCERAGVQLRLQNGVSSGGPRRRQQKEPRLWGVTVHRRKRTTQTLLRHWEMTQDCYHVLGSLGCISPTRSGQAVKGTVIAIHRWSVEAAAPPCSYFPGSSVSQTHRRGVQTTIGQERKGRKPETEHQNTGHAALPGPQRESGRFSVLGSSLTHWF